MEMGAGMKPTNPRPERAPERAATPPLRELRGVVERITYQNPENGYTVARLSPERDGLEAEAVRGDERLVTIVGTLADLTPAAGGATIPSMAGNSRPSTIARPCPRRIRASRSI
jgi:hypothetical protein